jgi:hypothetical protein
MSQFYEVKSFGEAGSVFCKTTNAVTAPPNVAFHAIQIVSDAVFSALTGGSITGDSIIGTSIPSGQILFGNFTGFTLSSGAVIAYKNRY